MADASVRSIAESQLRERASLAAGPGGPTTARIDSFPFLGRLLVSGNVSRIRVAATEVTVEGVTFARVALDLRDVTFDRDRLLAERSVVIGSLGRGTAAVDLSAAELSERLGAPVTLEPGRASIELAGQTVSATASVTDGVLSLSVSGFSVPSLQIPRLPLVPCVADAEILAGLVRLTCSVDQVPPELAGRPLDQLGF